MIRARSGSVSLSSVASSGFGVYTLGLFSGVASACCAPVLAGVIALSGLSSSFAVAWSTAWGRLVLLKAAFFGVIALIGAANRRRVLPRLSDAAVRVRPAPCSDGSPQWKSWSCLWRSAPRQGWRAASPAEAEVASRIQSVAAPVGDGQLNLTVDPAQVGSNVVHLYFLDETGRPRAVTQPRSTLALDGHERVVDLIPAARPRPATSPRWVSSCPAQERMRSW